MKKTLLRALPMLFFGLLFALQSIHAQTYYVDASRPDDFGNGLTQGTAKKTIQAAVDVASISATILISPGTYDERVIIDKALVIDGLDKTQVNVTYTGAAILTAGVGVPTLFTVAAPSVTIKNITFTVNLDKVHSAIHSHGNVSGIVITDNRFVAAATGALPASNTKLAYTRRNAVGINIDTYDSDYSNVNTGIAGVAIQRNIVEGFIDGDIGKGGFRGGFQVDRAKDVLIGGDTPADGNVAQTINHDVISRFFVDGDVTVKNNALNGGGLEMSSTNNANGTVTIENNTFNGLASNTYTSQARFQGNTYNKAFVVKNNVFSNAKWGLSIENFRNITIEGNSFTPSVNDFRLITINTKRLLTLDDGVPEALDLHIKANTFNGLSSATLGKAIAFYNHKQDITNNYLNSNILIGGVGNQNVFNADIPTYIYIDNNNGNLTKTNTPSPNTPLAGYPEYGSNIAVTTTGYWAKDIRADQNQFFIDGALRTPFSLSSSQMTELDGKIFDKKDNSNIGEVQYYFLVTNVTTGINYAAIQEAIDAATTGNTIDVREGVYELSTGVVVNKEITLQGNNNVLSAKPILKGVGNVTNKSLIEIDAPNVTISNFEFQIAQEGDGLNGVFTTSDNFNNLTIADNVFKGMKGYSAGYIWESHAMKLGRGATAVNNQINVVRNTITYANVLAPELFGRGIYAFNTYGKIGGSNADKNTIAAVYAVQGGELGGGVGKDFEFSYNDVQVGVVSAVGAEVGNHKLSNNNIGYDIPGLLQANGIARLLEVKGSRTANANIEISGNTISKYANVGIFVQRSNNVTIKDNTLTPIAGAAAFNSIVFSSKEGTSGPQAPVTSENLTITGNTLNSNAGSAGTGIAFWNHNGSAAVKPLINAKIGGSDTDKNTFSADLTNYIVLDATPSGGDTGNAGMGSLYDIVQIGFPNRITNIFPFNGDVDASYNVFGGVNTGTETNFDALLAVKTKIADGVDDLLTGYVNIQPNKAFVGALAILDNALNVVPDDFTLVLKNDVTVYGALSNRTITKAHTFSIDSYTTGEITFGDLTINVPSKEVVFAQGAKVGGNFILSAGKVTPLAGLTLEGTVATAPDISNFINGAVTVNNVSSGVLIPVGKNSKAAYVELTETTGSASSFSVEYFPAAHSSSIVIGLTSVSANEHWSIVRTGDLSAKVKLYSFDLDASGIPMGALSDVVVARFVSSTWVSEGQSSFFGTGPYAVTANDVSSTFGYFTFGATTTVLPVELLSFTATAATGGALVKWSTAKEENNAKFEVEKSFDGKRFFTVDSRKGQGNSATTSSYEFLDVSFKQSAYYRLVQVDISGKSTTYTDLTKFVKGLDNSLSVVAYPNPVTTKLYVTVGTVNKESVKVLLSDLTGKTLKVKTADNSQPIELDVADIATGSYILQVIKDSGNVSKKILKL